MSIETQFEYHVRRASEEHRDAVEFSGLLIAARHRRLARMHREMAREFKTWRAQKKPRRSGASITSSGEVYLCCPP